MGLEQDERRLPSVSRVVVGIDDGAASRAALVFGAALAGWLRVPLLAVHAYVGGRAGPETPLLRFGDPALVARETLDGAIERAQVEDGVTYPITPLLVRGHGAAVLLEHAGHDGIIVVGHHRRHGRAALPEWSLPAQIAGRASSAVAVVPASWRPGSPLGPVCVGADLPRPGAALLEQALGMASAAQLPLEVIHAEPSRSRPDPRHSDPGRLHRALQAELDKVSAPGAQVSLVVREGGPGLVLEAASRDAAFLIVGRHAAGRRTAHRLGTVARHVLRTAACPVVFMDAVADRSAAGKHGAAPTVLRTAQQC